MAVRWRGPSPRVMGVAVILEQATGISFGIDTFFFPPWESTASAAPGRMATSTAISFAITGIALVQFSRGVEARTANLRHSQLGRREPGSDVAHRLRISDHLRPALRSRFADGVAHLGGVFWPMAS